MSCLVGCFSCAAVSLPWIHYAFQQPHELARRHPCRKEWSSDAGTEPQTQRAAVQPSLSHELTANHVSLSMSSRAHLPGSCTGREGANEGFWENLWRNHYLSAREIHPCVTRQTEASVTVQRTQPAPSRDSHAGVCSAPESEGYSPSGQDRGNGGKCALGPRVLTWEKPLTKDSFQCDLPLFVRSISFGFLCLKIFCLFLVAVPTQKRNQNFKIQISRHLQLEIVSTQLLCDNIWNLFSQVIAHSFLEFSLQKIARRNGFCLLRLAEQFSTCRPNIWWEGLCCWFWKSIPWIPQKCGSLMQLLPLISESRLLKCLWSRGWISDG